LLRLSFFIVLALGACADPCRQVAEVVCACELDQSRERTCLAEVEAARQAHPASESDLQVCEQIIESNQCDCDTLVLGQIEACGLAQVP